MLKVYIVTIVNVAAKREEIRILAHGPREAAAKVRADRKYKGCKILGVKEIS